MNKSVIAVIIIVVLVVSIGAIFLIQYGQKGQSLVENSSVDQSQTDGIGQQEPIREGYGVYRTLPSSAILGQEIEVSLKVSIGDAGYYIIDEQYPEGLSVIDSSQGSTQQPGHIKWVVLSDAKDTVIKYKLSSPKLASVYKFGGTFVLGGGQEIIIIGDNQIEIK